MSMLTQIKKFFGVTIELPLTETETRLLNQLLANRRVALEQVIPDDMKNAFLSYVYSDRHLKELVKEIYRRHEISEDWRGQYLDLVISGCLGIKGFGADLIIYHRIDPEAVRRIMLKDISFT